MPTILTTGGLTIGEPTMGAPTASFYSILTTAGLVTAAPIASRPKMTSFHQWTLAVNWVNGVTEEVAYRTEVIKSRDGTEQRIAQRVNPRYSFKFDALVGPARAAELERLLVKRQATNYRFSHPRSATLLARAHPGAAGFIGRFDREAIVAARTDRVLSMEVSVQVNPGIYEGDYLTSHSYPAADTFHNDLEVLTLTPNWAEPVRFSFDQMSEILDRQRGVSDFYTPERFTTRTLQCAFMLASEAQEDRLRGLFERMRGQQGEFYMVDPMSAQIVTMADVPLGAGSITVAGNQVFQRFGGEQTYRNIAIRTRSGMLYRRISTISLVSGNSRLNLTETLPAISISDIIGIHWLTKMRFAADTLLLGWETDTVARTTVSLRALEDV